jgi:hypothetical protein
MVPVPRVVVLSLKVTFPVAVFGVTIAVKVTGWPGDDGFAEELTVTAVGILFTTWMMGRLMLRARLSSPPYTAVMTWTPTEGLATGMLGAETGAVPRLVFPSKNCTVPVGVPAPGETTETVALKVTGWPYTDGFAEDLTAVLVRAVLTLWTRAELVLEAYLESPSYTAWTGLVPAGSSEVVNWAVPPLRVALPSAVPLLLKLTFPVAAFGVTVAVKVTGWPYTDGFLEEVSFVAVWVSTEVTVCPPARVPELVA